MGVHMDWNTAGIAVGITLFSMASVYLLAAPDSVGHLQSFGKRRGPLLAIGLSLAAGLYLAVPAQWTGRAPQAMDAEADEVIARLRTFASTLAPSKHAPMSRVPTTAPGTAAELPDVDTMIDRLAARLAAAPQDGEGWKMLGWSFFHTDRPADAAQAYAKARALLPQSGDIGAALAEAIVARDGGVVSGEVQAVLDDVLRLAPQHPKARYLQALAKSQHGELAEALAAMRKIEAEVGGEEIWIDQMRARIAQIASSSAAASK